MRRRKLNKTILFILIFLISIGFAYLSTQLNINGGASVRGNTWDIHFEDVQVVESVDGNPTPTISSDKKNVDYVANLNEPGDVFSFNVDVVNAGTLDGMIESITNDGLTVEQQKLVNVEYKYANGDPFEEHFVILNGNRKTINVRVEYKYDIEEEDLPTELTSINLTFSITYQQATEDAYSTATFLPGIDVSTKMVSLSSSIPESLGLGSSSSKQVSPTFLNLTESYHVEKLSKVDGNAYITSFLRSNNLKDGLTNDNIVSTTDSETPIYMWFELNEGEEDLGTIYWYSDADVVYLNEDSSCFFCYFYDLYYCKFTSLTDISGITNVNTSRVSNMKYLFHYCTDLVDFTPVESWDTSNVEEMSWIFFECDSLIDLSSFRNWDVSKVTDMTYLFSGCESLTNLDGLSNWNTSNVTTMYQMFYHCPSLTDLSGLLNWDTSNVTNMYGMFFNCESLTNLYGLNNFNINNLERTTSMFSGCSRLSDLSDIKDWDVSNLQDISDMFRDCTSLTDATILNNWTISEECYFGSAFYNTGLTDSTKPSWYNDSL